MGDRLVDQLKRELEMDDRTASARGNKYRFSFEGDVDLDLTLNPENYLFKTAIGKCPQKNLDNFLLQVTEANLFFNGARGASLGYNEAENELTLSYELDYNCGYETFKEKIQDFVSSAVYWKEKIEAA